MSLLDFGKVLKFNNGKKIGLICKDKTLRIFKKERDLFRLYNGWGLNLEAIKECQNVGVELIEIRTEKYIYKTNIYNYLNNAIKYKNPKGEKDIQMILPLKWFYRWNL